MQPIRWRAVSAALLIHVALLAVLIRTFTPDIAGSVTRSVTQAFSISATPPRPPEPTASPREQAPREKGAAAPEGRKARARPVEAPSAPVALKPTQAPPVSASGNENAVGAAAQVDGTGAGGVGSGTGSGDGGTGTGGGGGTPVVKVAGDINSAKDYPRRTKDLRIGQSVTIDLGVGSDGRVDWCRVVRPSPDAAADALTCRLATDRFRFRPARDGAGQPRSAIYRWRQRWFY